MDNKYKYGESVGDLLNSNFQDRQQVLGPWCCLGDIVILFAPRGLGKTFLALQCAHAIETGTQFLKWMPPKARKVALIDGEMGREGLYHRLWQIDKSNEQSWSHGGLTVLTEDHCGGKIWNISDPKCQLQYEDMIAKSESDVIIIDNLLTCAEPMLPNDTDLAIWYRISPWLRKLRRYKKTVILIHHANKMGEQSGTQLKENIADTVVQLKLVISEDKFAGAVFDMHFSKSRWFFGKDKEPLRVKYGEDDEGKHAWHWKPLIMAIRDYAVRKIAQGWSSSDVCKVLGISAGHLTEALEYKSDDEKQIIKESSPLQSTIFAEDTDASPF